MGSSPNSGIHHRSLQKVHRHSSQKPFRTRRNLGDGLKGVESAQNLLGVTNTWGPLQESTGGKDTMKDVRANVYPVRLCLKISHFSRQNYIYNSEGGIDSNCRKWMKKRREK